MINWNEVKVRETRITDNTDTALVLGIDKDEVWCLINGSRYISANKFSWGNWTIYDPWVDVSHECIISSAYDIYHDGKLLTLKDEVNGQYKRQQGPGLRVWKRKEGVGDD